MNIERDYLKLLQDCLVNGTKKETRNGNTISVFGRQIRHKMSEGFPLLTTKKMAWKTMVTELLWFLSGDTNIKFLVDNNCHIWDGDAYKNYVSKIEEYTSTLNVPNDISEFQEIMDSVGNQIKSSVLSKEEFIHKIKTDDEFAKKWGDLGPVYGKQWRSWSSGSLEDKHGFGKIDQIANLINNLKTNPDSRRLMVTAWNPGELDKMTLPPCHYGFQVYTRELSLKERLKIWIDRSTDVEWKKGLEEAYYDWDNPKWAHGIFETDMDDAEIPTRAISLMWNQRSADVFLGLPFNIASYGLLLEIIAKAVGMIPDELVGNIGDAHLYLNHIEQAKEQMRREPYPLPKLNINTEWWPTESGECGEGPLDASAAFNGFKDENFCKCLLEEDIQLFNYQSHPTIKAPLSN